MNDRQTVEHDSPREEIDNLIASGEATRAHTLLARLWKQTPDPATAGFVVSRFERLRPDVNPVSCRIAMLRSFTVEPVIPLLRAGALVDGIDLVVHVGDFNAYVQEILDQGSGLYRFEPDIAVLAVESRDVTPGLWNDFADLSPAQVSAEIERVTRGFRSWVEAFRSGSQAHLVLHTLELPFMPGNGLLDAQSETGQGEAFRRINLELLHLAREYAGVYLLDYDALVGRHGRVSWHDGRKWLTMRMPIAADCLIHLANEWLRFIHALTGKVCKALVIDLDNTLWGGVIGEDGMSGIKLGPEYPGAAYQGLQRAVLDMYRRGVILAVCSKNNPRDAMEVLEHHPGMLLRPKHFTALRINWNDKAENLREIALELNVGTDALGFLDDNPTEREWIRSQLPEVTVIDLPDDPMGYARALRDTPVFERLGLSVEDRERGRYYAEQRLRTKLEQGAPSLEEFYWSLQMEVEVSLVTPGTLARVAQLTQKTNQFNLTAHRYSEQQISGMVADPGWRVYSMRVRDRFGDNGVAGVAITHYLREVCEIDTFLLSCRVIGRTVETALLATIAEQGRMKGCQRLVGRFLPTKKNAPAREFYPSHGFTRAPDRDGGSRWEFDLGRGQIASPPWIKRHVMMEAISTTGSILDQVRRIAADVFTMPLEQVTTESSAETIGNWDSLQHLNVVLALEQSFGLEFAPEEIEQMLSVEAIVMLVQEKLAQGA